MSYFIEYIFTVPFNELEESNKNSLTFEKFDKSYILKYNLLIELLHNLTVNQNRYFKFCFSQG